MKNPHAQTRYAVQAITPEGTYRAIVWANGTEEALIEGKKQIEGTTTHPVQSWICDDLDQNS